MSKNVVILGAGPAGLSAAWCLSREGVQVNVLEMESQVGGLCRSVIKGDFIFDLGGHRFITNDNLVLSEIGRLMGEELMVRSRKSVIRIRGKFFEYPLVLSDILKKMDPVISLKAAVDFFLTKLGAYSKISDVSLENWIIKRFGKTMYTIYFGPYSQKLWGMPPAQISSAWVMQRISLVDLTDVILRALGKKKDMPKTYARNFLYPKKGIGEICEYMSEEIQKNNGKIHLNAKVMKIVLKNRRIEKIIYIQNNSEKEISGDFVVSTIPLPEFILNIEPRVDARYLAIAERMAFRSLKLLHLMLNVEQVTDNTWMYIPEEEYLFFRIQDRRNWSPTVVAKGKTALTLEIACTKNDSVWNAPDSEIFERCVKDLNRLGLVPRGAVDGYFSEKVEHAYPIYSLDYHDKVAAIYGFLSEIRDFITIGRQGLYRYNNMDHSLKMGILTAKHILYSYPRQKILAIATENKVFDC